MQEPKLLAQDLCKRYGGTVALDRASVAFHAGEVHALIGKNGAGKSTLVKILAGAVAPDGGKLVLDGRQVHLASPRDALSKGIATVYQELSLIPGLTVGENILLGRLPRKRPLGVPTIDWPGVFAAAREALHLVGADFDPRLRAGELGVAQQQVVEIAKAMSYSPAVLMLDEPTSALASRETERLLQLIGDLARRGVAVIYISHRLEEVLRVADRISVLRDGKCVGTVETAQATPDTISHMMFGQVVQKGRPRRRARSDNVVLELRHFGRQGKLLDVSFSLHEGEILGIAGMMGSGRTELLRAIFGVDPFDRGELLVNGRPVGRPSPAAMKEHRVGLIPEDRKTQGLVQLLSIRENLCLASLTAIATRGVVRRRKESNLVETMVHRLGITAADVAAPVSSLSGGNQQKVVVGNWLNTGPRILLFDEPTRGIDIQAKQQIFQTMRDLSDRGIGILFVSTELEEIIEVADRVLIMKKGRLSGERDAAETTAAELLRLTM